MKRLLLPVFACVASFLVACGSFSEFEVTSSTGRVNYTAAEREEAIERRTQAILDEGVITDPEKARERARQEIWEHEVTGVSATYSFFKSPPGRTITPPSSSGESIRMD